MTMRSMISIGEFPERSNILVNVVPLLDLLNCVDPEAVCGTTLRMGYSINRDSAAGTS